MARILVIDDDLFVRRTIRFLLEALGHEASEAEHGRHGVDLQRAQRFDVVITDLVMPVQDGLETIRILKSEFTRLPIIAMSGSATPLGKARLADACVIGAVATLAKPFTTEDLLSALIKCHDHSIDTRTVHRGLVDCTNG